ncbi:DcrB-related protein [Bisgaard Taxon 46]
MFYFNEGSLDIGEEWQDRSLILLSHPSNLSISISREAIPVGMSFSEYTQRQLTLVSQQLQDYHEEKRSEIEVDNLLGILSEFTWSSPQGTMYQMSAILNLPVHPIIITTSALNPLTEGQRSYLLNLVKSFKARQ